MTLEQLLQSRDNRAKHQKDLLGKNPGRSLLCLTVQLPGTEKRNATSLKIARVGVEAIREAFSPEYEELRDLETGYEGYFLVSLPAPDAKRLACRIEDTHPLGRLEWIKLYGLLLGKSEEADAFYREQLAALMEVPELSKMLSAIDTAQDPDTAQNSTTVSYFYITY